jgi:hypothetical protein
MANVKGQIGQFSRSTGSDGDFKYLRLLRDGSLSVAGFLMASIMEGRGHMITVGAFSTGIVGGGDGTVLDADQPEFIVSVPSGTSIMPIRIDAQVQTGAPTDAQEVEILYAADQDQAMASAGTSTSETIYNLNTLKGSASACTAISAATVDTTSPTLDIELARKVIEYDVVTSGTLGMDVSLLYEPKCPIILNGPAMLIGYWGGDTATVGGFAQVQWLEFPTTFFAT